MSRREGVGQGTSITRIFEEFPRRIDQVEKERDGDPLRSRDWFFLKDHLYRSRRVGCIGY